MCGVAGVLGQPDELALGRALRALAHRGPDGEGIVVHGRVGLGHRRLAVVDPRAIASQPMWSADGAAVVVFNGEIYDHDAHRRELGESSFRTRSDTEVLLRFYLAHGLREVVRRLRGMYAFAIYDTRTGELHVARDPFGKKPLYYSTSGERFAFASTIPSLLELLRTRPELRPEAIVDYLTLTYVPGPGTIFEGVRALPPGTTLTVRPDGSTRQTRFFEPKLGPFEVCDERELVDLVGDALDRAVRRRLVADVPVGAFLSGGIDSSLVVAAMARASARVTTIAMGFEDAVRDEREAARRVASHFGTDHHEILLASDFLSDLPRFVHHLGQPLGDHAAVPTWLLARRAREHVTVVLTGDGGDELFAGYETSRVMAARDLVRGLPLAGVLRHVGDVPGALGRRARRLAASLDDASPYVMDPTGARGFRGRLDALLSPAFAARVAGHDPDAPHRVAFRDSAHRSSIDRALEVDLVTQLPDALLVKLDTATMGHGLEARCPFLDLDLFMLAARIPGTQKLAGLETKAILRRLARQRLPRDIAARPKRGFSPDLDRLYRVEREHRTICAMLLGPGGLDERFVSRGEVARLLEEHGSGAVDHGQRIHALLILDVFLRMYVDGSLSESSNLRTVADDLRT